jgi:hypothetical protein
MSEFEMKVTHDGVEHNVLAEAFYIWQQSSMIKLKNFDLNFLKKGDYIKAEDLFGNAAEGFVFRKPEINHSGSYHSMEVSFRNQNQINDTDEKERIKFYKETGLTEVVV